MNELEPVICTLCGNCRPDLYSFQGWDFGGNTRFWFCETCIRKLCYLSIRSRLTGNASTEEIDK